MKSMSNIMIALSSSITVAVLVVFYTSIGIFKIYFKDYSVFRNC